MLVQKLPYWLWRGWYCTYSEFSFWFPFIFWVCFVLVGRFGLVFLCTRRQSVFLKLKTNEENANVPLCWSDIFPGRNQASSGFQTSKSVLCGA